MKVRPDQKLVWMRNLEEAPVRVTAVKKLLGKLAGFVADAKPGAPTKLPPPTPVLVKKSAHGRR